MEPDFGEIGKLLQGGGNAALIVCVYFIYKAAHRLSRIEVMLEILLTRENGNNNLRFRAGDSDKSTNDLRKLLRERTE